ncbi:MAG TPA: hypothetical protein VMX16_04160 [Terriglobia bacterium]|nr:hypothetical protein [Terriglobia bacterium]
MDKKQKHLEMILRIVDRLSTNSFLLKGWSVVLVSALFALAGKDAKMVFVYLSYFPAFAFWGLDGFFLRQERLYRQLYDEVRSQPEDSVDFSMDTTSVSEVIQPWLGTCLSKTLLGFHGTVTGTIILVMFLMLTTR